MARPQEEVARDLLTHVLEFLQHLDLTNTVAALELERRSKREMFNNSLRPACNAGKDARQSMRAELVGGPCLACEGRAMQSSPAHGHASAGRTSRDWQSS